MVVAVKRVKLHRSSRHFSSAGTPHSDVNNMGNSSSNNAVGNSSSSNTAVSGTTRMADENHKLIEEVVLMAVVGSHEHLVTIIGVITSGTQP
jgi:hypothetical protein